MTAARPSSTADSLPSPGDTDIGGTLLPQVFGDPEVKYLGGCTFVYSSIILVAANPDSVVAQTMGVHRSTDCGHTWQGPFEVKAATNPTSIFDAADKEFMDVDPDTGRLIMTWTNFQGRRRRCDPFGFSDNGGRNWPASTRRIIANDRRGRAVIRPALCRQWKRPCVRRVAPLPVSRRSVRVRQHGRIRALASTTATSGARRSVRRTSS